MTAELLRSNRGVMTVLLLKANLKGTVFNLGDTVFATALLQCQILLVVTGGEWGTRRVSAKTVADCSHT